MIGPVVLEVKVHFAIGDDSACVTVGLRPGEPVTEADLLAAVGQALAGVRAQFEGAELLDAHRFFNHVLVKEKTGRIGKFALPAEFDYDVAELEIDAADALQQAKA